MSRGSSLSLIIRRCVKTLSQSPGEPVNSINGADKLLLIFARKDVTYDSDYVKYMVQDVKRHEYDPNSKSSQAFKHFQETDMDINDERTRFDWAAKQCYIAMANMMMAAAALNDDSCPMKA